MEETIKMFFCKHCGKKITKKVYALGYDTYCSWKCFKTAPEVAVFASPDAAEDWFGEHYGK